MIASLRGKVSYILPPAKRGNFVVIDVVGVGYQVGVPGRVAAGLKAGQELLLYTHLEVREDSHELFGFSTREELQFFQLLLSVQRVGTRMAIHLLDVATIDEIRQAVAANAPGRLAGKPGIGERIAELLIAGLRGKLMKTAGSVVSADAAVVEESRQALLALGFPPAEAERALARVNPQGKTSETIIRAALKELGAAPVKKERR